MKYSKKLHKYLRQQGYIAPDQLAFFRELTPIAFGHFIDIVADIGGEENGLFLCNLAQALPDRGVTIAKVMDSFQKEDQVAARMLDLVEEPSLSDCYVLLLDKVDSVWTKYDSDPLIERLHKVMVSPRFSPIERYTAARTIYRDFEWTGYLHPRFLTDLVKLVSERYKTTEPPWLELLLMFLFNHPCSDMRKSTEKMRDRRKDVYLYDRETNTELLRLIKKYFDAEGLRKVRSEFIRHYGVANDRYAPYLAQLDELVKPSKTQATDSSTGQDTP